MGRLCNRRVYVRPLHALSTSCFDVPVTGWVYTHKVIPEAPLHLSKGGLKVCFGCKTPAISFECVVFPNFSIDCAINLCIDLPAILFECSIPKFLHRLCYKSICQQYYLNAVFPHFSIDCVLYSYSEECCYQCLHA